MIDYIFTCEECYAMREVDWTYRFFTCENIAHIEFYLQGLLPKILAVLIEYFIESATHGFLFTSCKTLEDERVNATNG